MPDAEKKSEEPQIDPLTAIGLRYRGGASGRSRTVGVPARDLTIDEVKRHFPHQRALESVIAAGVYEACEQTPRLPKKPAAPAQQ